MKKALMVVPRASARYLDEALSLAETAGYSVVGVRKSRYERRLGRGLVKSLSDEARSLSVDTIIFYGDLQPSSAFLLTKESGVRVIDRVMLILEIFAKHAGSREALLQIEMARIKHEIPLVREAIRRSKMGEYPGFMGPGRYAIDSYYRHLTSRLSRIRRELEKLRMHRESRLKKRIHEGFLHVALVGYASAGKTSLFNALTGESRPVGDEYFTTLHPKHKAIKLGNGKQALIADTVGFIRDVPPEIIEAFHATLSDIRYSDVIVFILDVSEPAGSVREKLEAGLDILSRIEALGIPMIIAANKIDLLEWGELGDRLRLVQELSLDAPYIHGVIPVSAKKRVGLDRLVREIGRIAAESAPGKLVW